VALLWRHIFGTHVLNGVHVCQTVLLIDATPINMSLCCQALPLPVLELALRSENLQLVSENDTYALVGGWVDSQPEGERAAAFSRLVRCLRFHQMSGSFLSTVVGQSEYRSGCMYLVDACLRAFAFQSIAASSPQQWDEQHPFATCKLPRAPPEPPLQTFEVQLELARCRAFEARECEELRLGVGCGHKVILGVARQPKEGAAATVGIFIRFVRPGTLELDDDADGDEVATVRLVGPAVAVRISAGRKTRTLHHAYAQDSTWGYPDFFGKPWEEVVHDGSAYFPEGRMTIKVDIQFLSDGHAPATMPAWWARRQ
jgi:hypothetical protein